MSECKPQDMKNIKPELYVIQSDEGRKKEEVVWHEQIN
jgi:hypothetical protein